MAEATVQVIVPENIGNISPNVHGHFMEHLGGCIEGGTWVGEDSPIPNVNGVRIDVLEALKQVEAPVIRWPGGCFADDYHWRDGIGTRSERPRRINIHWGNVIETNAFGTHEFMAFCREVGADPYFCGNVGSGTVQEMRDWVEYCNFPGDSTLARERKANGSRAPFNVRYWGVGNENWGCGGNYSPEDYGTEYRRYATYLRNWGKDPLYLIACGPNTNDLDWTRRFFEKLRKDYWSGPAIHGFAAHYYCGTAGTDVEYSTAQWYELLWKSVQMEKLVVEQRALLDAFDPERKIGLIVDEWGTWHPPTSGRNPSFLYQQNTMRDALVAALTLNIFHNHADKVVMSNIAQTINVLQALILTDGDKMLQTPTFHVYDLFRPHKGGIALRTLVECDAIDCTVGGKAQKLNNLSASASQKAGTITLTLVNTDAETPLETKVEIIGAVVTGAERKEIQALEGGIHAHNTFDAANNVHLSATVGIDLPLQTITLAPASVTRITIDLR